MIDVNPHVGVLLIELLVSESQSLKDKRRVLKSLKDRISNKFNVSVAEVGALDKWQRSILGVSLIANDAKFVDSCLQKVAELVNGEAGVQVTELRLELL